MTRRSPRLVALAAFIGTLAVATPTSAGITRNVIFQPPREALTTAGLPADAELVDVRTADGLALKAIHLPGRADAPLLLVFHGNASSARSAAEWLEPLRRDGFALLLAEYRGYSAQPGRPREDGLARDADAFYAEAK